MALDVGHGKVKPAKWNVQPELTLCPELWKDCKVYMPHWDDAGAPPRDISQNNNNSVFSSTPPTWATSDIGNYLFFDKNNDYYNIPASEDLNIKEGATWAFYVRDVIEANSFGYMYSHGTVLQSSSCNIYFRFRGGANSNRIRAAIGGNDVIDSDIILPLQGWTLIILRRSSTNRTQWYANGEPSGSAQTSTIPNQTINSQLFFGSRNDKSSERYLGGDVGFWAYWQRDIGEDAIRLLAEKPYAMITPDMKKILPLYFSEDEGGGGTVYNSSIGLALSKALGVSAVGSFGNSVTLPVTQDLSSTTNASIGSDISLPASTGVAFQAGSLAESIATISFENNISSSAFRELFGEIALDTQNNISPTANYNVFNNIDLTIDNVLNIQTNSQVEAQAVISHAMGFVSTAGRTVQAEIALALQTDIEASVSGVIDVATNLSFGNALGGDTQATVGAEMELSMVSVMATVGGAIVDAGLSLNCVQSLTIEGNKIIIDLQVPAGRTFVARKINYEFKS